MRCNNCGKELPDNSVFCYECGKPTAGETEQEASPGLSRHIKKWWKFFKSKDFLSFQINITPVVNKYIYIVGAVIIAILSVLLLCLG